jgi:hypothetical protein
MLGRSFNVSDTCFDRFQGCKRCVAWIFSIKWHLWAGHMNSLIRYVCLEEVCIECHGDCAAFHIYVLIDFDLVKDMLLVFHITL